MHVRAVTFTGASNIDQGVAYVRDTVAPILDRQKGYRGMTVSVDRENGVVGILSLWESSEDRDASDAALMPTREEGAKIIGGTLSVENMEQMVVEMVEPPVVGSPLTVTRTSMDPDNVDDNVAFFKSEILPGILATPGIRAVRSMMNRETGHGMVGVVWANHEAMVAGAEAAKRRRELASARGIRFDDVSQREIVLVDFK